MVTITLVLIFIRFWPSERGLFCVFDLVLIYVVVHPIKNGQRGKPPVLLIRLTSTYFTPITETH